MASKPRTILETSKITPVRLLKSASQIHLGRGSGIDMRLKFSSRAGITKPHEQKPLRFKLCKPLILQGPKRKKHPTKKQRPKNSWNGEY